MNILERTRSELARFIKSTENDGWEGYSRPDVFFPDKTNLSSRIWLGTSPDDLMSIRRLISLIDTVEDNP